MKKRVLTGIVTGALVLATLAACSGGNTQGGGQSGSSQAQQAQGKGTVTVAATAVPHAEILEEAKKIMAEDGWDLQITVFDDYVQPNMVVNDGDIDANYFQHQPYLDQFNEENGTDLVSVGWIHYEPLGIYAGKSSDLADIPDGVSIAVPNDTTNEARALQLLEANGIIKLKEGAGLNATKIDVIAAESHNAEIVELDASQVSKHAEEVDFMVLNGNYALEAGLNAASDALAYELSDSDAAKTYVNVITVKKGNEDNEGVKALVEVLNSDAIVQFIKDTYQGSVVYYEQ